MRFYKVPESLFDPWLSLTLELPAKHTFNLLTVLREQCNKVFEQDGIKFRKVPAPTFESWRNLTLDLPGKSTFNLLTALLEHCGEVFEEADATPVALPANGNTAQSYSAEA